MREIAETLGIDIEAGHRRAFNTLAGSFTAYGHAVRLHTLGLEFESLVYFAVDYGLPPKPPWPRGVVAESSLGSY